MLSYRYIHSKDSTSTLLLFQLLHRIAKASASSVDFGRIFTYICTAMQSSFNQSEDPSLSIN
jgi:hypothetical protein